jgi:hypothetical protein
MSAFLASLSELYHGRDKIRSSFSEEKEAKRRLPGVLGAGLSR